MTKAPDGEHFVVAVADDRGETDPPSLVLARHWAREIEPSLTIH